MLNTVAPVLIKNKLVTSTSHLYMYQVKIASYHCEMEDSRTNPTVYLDVAIGGRPGTFLVS